MLNISIERRLNKLILDAPVADNLIFDEALGLMISGIGQANETVTIVQNKQVLATVDADNFGRFEARIYPVAHMDIAVEQAGTVQTIKSPTTGKVLLFAGQSNMQFRMRDEAHFETEQRMLRNQKLPIFAFNVPEVDAIINGKTEPENAVWPKQWVQVTADNLGEMSAIAYLSAKEYLATHPTETIGIVLVAKGGTSASSWIPKKSLIADKQLFDNYVEPFEKAVADKTEQIMRQDEADFYKKQASYFEKRKAYIEAHPELTLAEVKNVVGHTPWPPPMTPWSYRRPGGLYETMLQPIARYRYSGVVWYQGEEDTNHASLYERLLKLVIHEWRETLQQDLPFWIIGLPKYEEEGKDWFGVRAAQQKVVSQEKRVYLISLADLGEVDNIHPTDKLTPAKRIARFILTQHGTPQAQIEQISPKLILNIQDAKRLVATEEIKLLVNQENTTAVIQENRLIVDWEGSVQTIMYGIGNVPDLTIFNEHGDPLAPFKMELEKGV